MAASLLKGVRLRRSAAAAAACWSLLVARAAGASIARAAFFETRFSAGVDRRGRRRASAASVWLGLFAFKHVDYSHELWWQFELHGDASRFLRASVGAAVVVAAVRPGARCCATRRTRSPRRATPISPPPARIIAAQPSTYPVPGLPARQVAALQRRRDGVRDVRRAGPHLGGAGRSGRARPMQAADLIRLFLERCDDFGGVPVFYEIGTGAPAPLRRLRADVRQARRRGAGGPVAVHARGRRRARSTARLLRRLEKDGGTFRVVAADGRAGADAAAARGVRRLARRQGGRREGLLARLLRRDYVAPLPGRRHRARRPHPGVRQPLARRRPRGAVDRSDALPPATRRERDGGAASST